MKVSFLILFGVGLLLLAGLVVVQIPNDTVRSSMSRMMGNFYGFNTAPSKPNIIFILADDMGMSDIGYKNKDISLGYSMQTPHLDWLAGNGIRLENYYSMPMCSPARSALLSGKYPHKTGLQHKIIVSNQPYGLPLDIKTLPSTLKDIGFFERFSFFFISHSI